MNEWCIRVNWRWQSLSTCVVKKGGYAWENRVSHTRQISDEVQFRDEGVQRGECEWVVAGERSDWCGDHESEAVAMGGG